MKILVDSINMNTNPPDFELIRRVEDVVEEGANLSMPRVILVNGQAMRNMPQTLGGRMHYQCLTCLRKLNIVRLISRLSVFNDHIWKKHPLKETDACMVCGKYLRTLKSLRIHTLIAHDRDVIADLVVYRGDTKLSLSLMNL